VPNKKTGLFGKKLQKYLFDFFTLKMAKTHFWEKLKNDVFSKKLFFALKALFPNAIPNMFQVELP
jgi:hypothetical protein